MVGCVARANGPSAVRYAGSTFYAALPEMTAWLLAEGVDSVGMSVEVV